MKKLGYKSTLSACYFGYVTQAIGVNLPPLLFVIFSTQFSISLEKIGLLVTINFVLQMLTDLAASKFAPKLGYRFCSILAHGLSIGGLILLAVLPMVMPPYAGLVISFALLAVGGGLIEVIISPVVDALPGESKSSSMSLLHSFYCWGMVAVVLLTTLFFALFGMGKWYILPIIWAIVPLVGLIMFTFVPFPPREEEHKAPYKKLFGSALFWLFLLMMLAAGAAEQSVAQWASMFAELGLGVNKSVGDLLGPCMFGVLMGLSRLLYGIFGKKLNLKYTLAAAGGLCVLSYVIIVFSPNPFFSLVGFALCGLGIGIGWPGVLSLAAKRIPTGGTTLFALMALGGDIGCALGPGLVGIVSNAVSSNPDSFFSTLFGSAGEGAGLKSGLMFAIIFPIMLCVCVLLLKRTNQRLPKNGEPLYKSENSGLPELPKSSGLPNESDKKS